jgi:hypothetical protein
VRNPKIEINIKEAIEKGCEPCGRRKPPILDDDE